MFDLVTTICGVALIAFVCWVILAVFLWSLLGVDRQTKVEKLESAMWTEAEARENYRLILWRRARGTGDWSDYDEQKAQDDAWLASQINNVVRHETCIDERTQYELDHGTNPYPRKQPAPGGRTIKARR